MLTFFLIMVKLSLYNFIRSHIQNIKELKRRCAHGVCRSSAGKEDRERFDRSVAVMADIVASVLAKLKNKAKASGISYQQSITTSESNLPALIEQYGIILYQRKD